MAFHWTVAAQPFSTKKILSSWSGVNTLSLMKIITIIPTQNQKTIYTKAQQTASIPLARSLFEGRKKKLQSNTSITKNQLLYFYFTSNSN